MDNFSPNLCDIKIMDNLDKKDEPDFPVPPDGSSEEQAVVSESPGVSGAEVGGSAELGELGSSVVAKPCDPSRRVGLLANRNIVRKIRATSDVSKTMYIDMVEAAFGCPEGCAACGAYDGTEKMVLGELSPDQIRDHLRKEIKGAGVKIVDLLRRYITTGIDVEPLFTNNFCDWARAIREESGGRSRGVCISHGLHFVERGKDEWKCPEVMERRLGDIVKLMMDERDVEGKQGVPATIPLFALSCDLQRKSALMGVPLDLRREHETLMGDFRKLCDRLMRKYGGQSYSDLRTLVTSGCYNDLDFGEFTTLDNRLDSLRSACLPHTIKANKVSYVETLIALAGPIRAGKRVTVSLQGDSDSRSLVYIGAVMRMWSEIGQTLQSRGFGDLLHTVNIDTPDGWRLYVNKGRAKTVLGGLDPSRYCTVVPDEDFLKRVVWSDAEPYRANRGILDVKGRVLAQIYRAMRTYNDTIDGPYNELDLDGGKTTASNGGGEG